MIQRRSLLALLAAPGPLLPLRVHAADAPLRSLVVLNFELVDDQHNPATQAAQERRLREATAQLQRELAERRLYRVLDAAPTQALQQQLRNQQEYLYRCDYCTAEVGRAAGAELAMSTWVQKVSELILNLNVQVVDVASEKLLFSKSVDMRGNQDESWRRAVSYLVRDMAEKRAARPGYAQ